MKTICPNILNEIRTLKELICPHCESHRIVKNGKSSGKQRYKCKDCHTSFNDFTNTPLSMTHYPEKWSTFIQCTLNDMSLRASAEELGVCHVTLFYWRHKLLTALRIAKFQHMKGIVESDDIYMDFSEKGKKNIPIGQSKKRGSGFKHFTTFNNKVSVVFAMDRNENTACRASWDGRLNKNNIDNILDGIVDNNNVLCSNNKPVYASYARNQHIKHFRLQYGFLKEKEYINIISVKKYICSFENWILHFNGVATKYLNNYLSLFRFLHKINFDKTINSIRKVLISVFKEKVNETYHSLNAIKCKRPLLQPDIFVLDAFQY